MFLGDGSFVQKCKDVSILVGKRELAVLQKLAERLSKSRIPKLGESKCMERKQLQFRESEFSARHFLQDF